MKTLGNEQRLLVLCNLLEQPMTVSELNQRMSLSQSALSQHLALLREAGLVETRRKPSRFTTRCPRPVTRVMALLQDIYCAPGSPAVRAGAGRSRPSAPDSASAVANLAARPARRARDRPQPRAAGSGGSILTVPVLHYLVGQPDKLAIGGSLLVVGLIAAAGCVPYALRRQVDWRNVAWFGLPGMGGAWVGATLAHWVSGAVQLGLFSGVMLLAAWRMLRGGSVTQPGHKATRLASSGAE